MAVITLTVDLIVTENIFSPASKSNRLRKTQGIRETAPTTIPDHAELAGWRS